MTKRELYIKALEFHGFEPSSKYSGKYIAYTKPSFKNKAGTQMYIFLGRNGAFRVGRNVSNTADHEHAGSALVAKYQESLNV